MSHYLNEGVEKGAICKSARDNFLKGFTGTISEDWTSAIDDENLYMYEGDYERYPPKKFDEGGLAEHQDIDDGINSEIRRSKVSFIPNNEETLWIYQKIAPMVLEANNNLWNFDLFGNLELIQYTKYEGDGTKEGNFYDWHMDLSKSANYRKISVIVQLSDETEYEGGDVFMKEGLDIQFPREKGTVIVFPSYILHTVTPVVSGLRESLVIWVSGPPLR